MAINFLFIVQSLFILFAALYVAFAFIVTRQIDIMSKTLSTSFTTTVTLIGYLHFAFAVLVWLLFLLLL